MGRGFFLAQAEGLVQVDADERDDIPERLGPGYEHPNPSRCCDGAATRRQHRRVDVSAVLQVAIQAHDLIELLMTNLDVTRVTLHGGVSPLLCVPL
jgi:hypothetical protein